MKHNATLTIASLLSILFMTITLIDLAVRGRHDELQRHGSFEYFFAQSGI